MQDVIIRDVRLEGGRPTGNEVLEVDGNTGIDWPINWVISKSQFYGGAIKVIIMAHGIEMTLAPGVGVYGRPIPQSSQGGGGIMVGKEGITLRSLDKFAAWRGKVPRIEILGCGAAYITPGFEGKEGDGNLLCFRLAQITQAEVRASTATQEYNPAGPIDFGPWEGTVITYSKTGGLVRVENSPSS